MPLAAGVVFVAVILPSTGIGGGADLTQAVLAGILSNLIILGIVLVLTLAARGISRRFTIG